MKLLPEFLKKNGFTYTLLLRGQRSCIYEQHVTQEMTYFEVFINKVKPEQVILGRSYTEREVFPGNEDFGRTAWSYRDYKSAMKRYDVLENHEF